MNCKVEISVYESEHISLKKVLQDMLKYEEFIFEEFNTNTKNGFCKQSVHLSVCADGMQCLELLRRMHQEIHKYRGVIEVEHALV